MLNVFTLSASINESINNAKAQPIVEEALPSYEFAGSIDEATQNLSYAVMMESLESKQFCVGSDEIMVESVMAHSENYDTLVEAVNVSFIKKIGEKIQKFIAWIGGLIKKLVDWVNGAIGKSKTYQKQIKSAIEKVKDKVNAAEVKSERYLYPGLNVSSNNALIAAIGNLRDKYIGEMGKSTEDAITTADYANMLRNNLVNDTAVEKESELDERIQFYREIISDNDKGIIKDLATKLGVNIEIKDDTKVKEIMDAYVEQLRGEKKEVSVADLGGADAILNSMVKAPEQMNDMIESLKKLQKELDGIAKQFSKVKVDALKAVGDNTAFSAKSSAAAAADEEDGKIKAAAKATKVRAQVSSKCATLFNAIYARFTTILTTLTTIVNMAQTNIRTLTSEKVAADVALLNMYVRAAKAKKVDEEEAK